MRFVCAVPLGWSALLLVCAAGIGGLVVAMPALRTAIKAVGIAYLLWLAWKLSRSGRLADADTARMDVGFWASAALQFVNIKAWLLALAIVAGWVAGRPDSLPRPRGGGARHGGVRLREQFPLRRHRRAAAPVAGPGRPPALVQPRHGGGARSHRRLDGDGMSTVPASTASPAPQPVAARSPETRGLLWGLLGVAIFALTLPMTRLAVGTPEAPQLPGAFVAIARAAIAGLLSVALLLAQRAPLPARADWLPLAVTSLGVVFGFPLLTSLAMRHVAAVHASVVIGLLPLATARWWGRCCTASGPPHASGSARWRAPRWWWPSPCGVRRAAGWRCIRPICCCSLPCSARPWVTASADACRNACRPAR